MSRPRFPVGTALPVGAIDRIRAEQEAYDRDPEGYERDRAWSLEESIRRGSLPNGEPIEALYGAGEWSER